MRAPAACKPTRPAGGSNPSAGRLRVHYEEFHSFHSELEKDPLDLFSDVEWWMGDVPFPVSNFQFQFSNPMTYEHGPMRPPSEAGSLLLRFTRNCPWNQRTFCPLYKGQEFSRCTLEGICRDIDAVGSILEDLRRLSCSLGLTGQLNQGVMNTVMTSPTYGGPYRYVALWAFSGSGRVCIQDANSLMLPSALMVEALQ
jgi:hypothetical protein